MRKKILFQRKNFLSLCFLISLSLIAFKLQLQRGHKIYWILLCNSKERFLKTYEVKGRFLKKNHLPAGKNVVLACFLVLPVMLLKTQFFKKEIFGPSFFVLCSIKNLSEQFITTHIVSWHFFCIIKLRFDRTYETVGDIL